MAEVSMEFIAAQLERVLDEQAKMRDDMTVVMGRVDHMANVMTHRFEIVDETLKILLKEVRALRRDDERLGRRLSRLEEHVLPQS